MKRISFLMITMLMACTVLMAQGRRRGEEPPKVDPKERAERMTEHMVKEYSLNDSQKQKLYEVNLAMAENMKDRPAMRYIGRQGKKANSDMDKQSSEDKDAVKKSSADKGKRRPEMSKEDREKFHNKMKEARAAYDAKIKEIMTDEQYSAYTKNQEDRQGRMKQRRVES